MDFFDILYGAVHPWSADMRAVVEPGSPDRGPEQPELTPRQKAFLQEVAGFIDDNQWHESQHLLSIARSHGFRYTPMSLLTTHLPQLAESDSGRYICHRDIHPPCLAPDGT